MAGGGHLRAQKWAREHDCPWDAMTLYLAEQNGHMEVLRWAREHDCPEEPPLVSDNSGDSYESEDSDESEESEEE